MTIIHVKVETRHILAGKPEDCGACPVALAIQEATGDPTVEVASQVWRMKGAHIRSVASLPGGVFGRIGRYDRLHQMEPFEFELEWPE